MADTPIKILQLLASMPVGGAEQMVAALATALDPREFQVRVACIGAPGPMAAELSQAGHPVVSLGLDLKHTSKFTIIRRLRALLRELQPDILHTHLYHPNLYGRLASLGLGLKGRVATVHNLYKRVKLHRRLCNYLLGRVSDYVVVFSPEVAKDVLTWDRLPPARLRLVSPGIRLESLEVPETQAQARERLAVTGFCLGTVARLEEQKGLEDLLAAVSRVVPEIPDLTLLIVGDGSRRPLLAEQARSLGLAQAVRFLGTRRDVPHVLRALDLFVMPSRWEGIPLTLLEAMGAGLPVVSTRVGRAGEIITPDVNGLLVPPGDVPALAAALLAACRQPEARRAWGREARRTVQQRYSLDCMLGEFAEIYRTLACEGHRP
jgi:glycosyltransferase involved in cell wall biosynthesis